MQPLPTTGVARFPGGRRLNAKDNTGQIIDLVVLEITIIGEKPDGLEVRIIPKDGPSQTFVIQPNDAYAFMQHGIPEPPLDPTTTVPSQYKSWPITGPYGGGDAPRPWDVIQGSKNNCRIMSGLQVLALCQPKLLMNALTVNAAAGMCTIRLRRTPGPKQEAATNAPFEDFTFSTALPCKLAPGPAQLLYAGADTDTTYLPLWACFFEKALAIMWGGYGALTGAEERSLMSALGVTQVTTFQFSGHGALNPERWITFIKASFPAGRPMTTFIMGKQHNYGIVGVSDDGVVICDPNSRQTGNYFERWQGGYKVFDNKATTLMSSANFPMFLTWEQYFENFLWVHIFHA